MIYLPPMISSFSAWLLPVSWSLLVWSLMMSFFCLVSSPQRAVPQVQCPAHLPLPSAPLWALLHLPHRCGELYLVDYSLTQWQRIIWFRDMGLIGSIIPETPLDPKNVLTALYKADPPETCFIQFGTLHPALGQMLALFPLFQSLTVVL